MLKLFSADTRYQTWRKLWVALAKEEMALGLPITQTQVDELAAAIAEWQGTVGEERKSCHVANLKKRHSAVREGDVPACPYCGGRMVLRTRKKDGAKFYGCASYPACRGVVNIA